MKAEDEGGQQEGRELGGILARKRGHPGSGRASQVCGEPKARRHRRRKTVHPEQAPHHGRVVDHRISHQEGHEEELDQRRQLGQRDVGRQGPGPAGQRPCEVRPAGRRHRRQAQATQPGKSVYDGEQDPDRLAQGAQVADDAGLLDRDQRSEREQEKERPAQSNQ